MIRRARLLLTTAILAISAAQSLPADEYIVNDFGDLADAMAGDGSCSTNTGSCTLRAAITEANAAFGPDLVSFAQTDDVVLNTSLLGTIFVTDALTIQGSGNKITAVGLGASMLDFSGVNTVVDLRDLTFTNPSGEGISIDIGADVLILDCVVKGNNSGTAGGGVLITGGTLVIRATEIEENTATAGAAIWAVGSSVVTIQNSVIRDNTSTLGVGGAIQSIGATLEITNTNLFGNTAATDGGAISASGNLTLGPDVVIDDNEALAGDGGGVHFLDFSATNRLAIGATVISNNEASADGGGLYYWSNTGAFEVTTTALILNQAGDEGGGLYYVHPLAGGPQILRDGKIAANESGLSGGVHLATGVLQISSTTVSHNQALTQGGGIYLAGGFHQVANSTISTNTAGTGGGIYGASTSANLSLFNTTVFDNQGGGVHSIGGAPIVTLSNSLVAKGPSGTGDDCDSGANPVNPNLDSDGSCGASVTADPLLGPLVLVTSTAVHVPQAGSPAAGAGSNAVCAAAPVGGLDQNGAPRPFSGNCDLGSVESGGLVFVDGFESGSTSQWSQTTR